MSTPGNISKKLVFYDIHMHAFNLSHPSLSVFIRRTLRETVAKLFKPRHWHRGSAILGLGLILLFLWVIYFISLAIPWAGKKVRRAITKAFTVVKRLLASVLSMLAVFDNDVGSMFLVMENCLRHSYSRLLDAEDNHLRIDGNAYPEIVLTPLMMDFGHKWKIPQPLIQPKDKDRGGKLCHYDCPAEKPIVAQVVDVFAAIKKYIDTESTPNLQEDYPELSEGTKRVFHIYPFLGLNTANYDIDGVSVLLEKYFSDYRGLKEDLDQRMGQFDGEIDHLGSNFFSGIKVYPPLGFDPWPEGEGERDKVRALYQVAEAKGIPMTCHGGSGGFRAIPLATAKDYASIGKWASVLDQYPNLKVNLAHFPINVRELARRNQTFQLLQKHDNVYVDISCRATNPGYYEGLARFISELTDSERDKFMRNLLFGSDFAVNLLWTESYNAYVSLFAETKTFTPDEKRALCSTNPERFLFNTPPTVP